MAAKSKSRKNTVVYIVMGVIFVGVLALALIFNRKVKIGENPAEMQGNTTGNLNNNGLFCESDGVVYFSNPFDSCTLYRMDPVTLEASKISDVPVSYINAAGDYLYFYYNDNGGAKFMGFAGNMKGVYRVPKNGKDTPSCLDRTTSGIVSLLGNRLYYQHYDSEKAMTLYYTALDGSESGELLPELVNPACVRQTEIYYPDTLNKNYLTVFNPLTGSKQLYLDARVYNPTIQGDYIYYMNVDDDYKLYRYDMYNGTASKITNERVDLFNVYGGFVFYQTNSKTEPKLMRMYADGSSPEIIAEGIYTDVNCTSTYTYFRPYDDELTFYMTPTTGMTNVTSFIPKMK